MPPGTCPLEPRPFIFVIDETWRFNTCSLKRVQWPPCSCQGSCIWYPKTMPRVFIWPLKEMTEASLTHTTRPFVSSAEALPFGHDPFRLMVSLLAIEPIVPNDVTQLLVSLPCSTLSTEPSGLGAQNQAQGPSRKPHAQLPSYGDFAQYKGPICGSRHGSMMRAKC